jgi:hypothetical protein
MKSINMKKYIIILTLFLTALNCLGQDKKESSAKVKALKVAFLTQELQLTSMEAEKFWPLYNKHREKLDSLRYIGRAAIKKKIKEVGDLNNLEESEAKKFVLLRLNLERQISAEREAFVPSVSPFLPYKKILKLYISEREFAKKLMQKYGRGKNKRN